VPHPRSVYALSFHPDDKEKVLQAMDEVIEGKAPTTHFRLRLVTPKGIVAVALILQGVRNRQGEVVKVIGYRARAHDLGAQNHVDSALRVRVGFWAKNLRTGQFITPDEDFCRIYRVDRNSKSLDRDIRARYLPEDAESAYDFIDEAVRSGQTRGSRDFRLVFEDGTDLWVRLEFFIESDEAGPVRANGTVLAFR